MIEAVVYGSQAHLDWLDCNGSVGRGDFDE